MKTTHAAWKRKVGIMDHCLTLAMLHYENQEDKKAENYVRLSEEYYEELLRIIRSRGELLEREVA